MEEKRKEKVRKRVSLRETFAALKDSAGREGGVGGADAAVMASVIALGFLFSGTHTVFGAYPLGIALVSALPCGVWCALLGTAVGALTIGKSGLIYALVSLLSVLLRVVISASSHFEKGTIFSESVLQRLSAATLGSAVCAVYELLGRGVTPESVLYSSAMILISVGATFILTGAFGHGYGLRTLILGTRPLLFTSDDEGRGALKFKLSALFLLLLISLSLKRFDLFGINLGFVFSGVVTLFSALRFGSLYAAIVGFVSSFGLSGIYSPAFALGGAVAGLLSPFGKHLALVGACLTASLWGAYASGTLGFLSIFPEVAISAFFILPVVKYLEKESAPDGKESRLRKATDMVGTMALSYRNGIVTGAEELEKSVKSMTPAIARYLGKGEALEDFTLFAKLLEESRERELPERELDGELTDALEPVLFELGLSDGVIRAFGDRHKHIILAAKDPDGSIMTSPALKRRLEEVSGLSLGKYDYYRRDEMAVTVCESVAAYKVSFGTAAASGGGEVSGDSVLLFSPNDESFAMIISDGMGSGEEAKMASALVCDIFRSGLSSGASCATLIHLANSLLRRKGNECSASLDMFYFDTVRGEGCFYKSGAAPSYIKRRSSLFRIKSETMPLGIMGSVDSERIGASVEPGDTVISISDGVCGAAFDAPWLVELINTSEDRDPETFAKRILDGAKRYSQSADDMTVAVVKIERI